MSFKTLDILTGIKPDSDKLWNAVSLPPIQFSLSINSTSKCIYDYPSTGLYTCFSRLPRPPADFVSSVNFGLLSFDNAIISYIHTYVNRFLQKKLKNF